MTRFKVVFEPDPDPDFSWLEQWNTPATYAGNEVLIDGKPLPFADYIRTVGNPDMHAMICMVAYKMEDGDDDWTVADSLSNIDFMEAGSDYVTGTFYCVDDIPAECKYLRELATEAGLPQSRTR